MPKKRGGGCLRAWDRIDQCDVPFVEGVEGEDGFVDFVFEGLGVGGGVGLFGGLDAGGEGGEARGRGRRGVLVLHVQDREEAGIGAGAPGGQQSRVLRRSQSEMAPA